MTPEHLWEGVDGAVSEHRTVGEHRAWCFTCSEWCYSQADHCPCCMEHIGITLDNLIAELRELFTHFAPDYRPMIPHLEAVLAKYDMDSSDG